MTEQEKEELRRKIEARKQREAAGTGTVNNNQQTCTGCGSVIPANYDVCPVCGKVLRQGEKLKQQPQMQSGNSDRGKGVAIASLVLGIVGSVLALFGFLVGLWLCVPSFICGIAGLVTAKKAKKNGCISEIRTAGFILSIIATVLGGIGVIVLIANIAVGSVKNFVALVKNGSFLVRITDMTILIEKEFIYGSSKRPNPTDYYRKQHYQCG